MSDIFRLSGARPLWHLRRVLTVVVVDDDDAVRDAIAESLGLAGYDVRTAGDGQAALAVLRAAPRPCVALIDLVMPRVDGATLMRLVRDEPAFAGVAVICCTAGRDAPPDGAALLRKPFDEAALMAAIEQAFSTLR
jgi:CheY-like chemotaxis protein